MRRFLFDTAVFLYALQMRDAIHAATALNRGIDLILSPDTGFDDVEGLERLDPMDAEATLLPKQE